MHNPVTQEGVAEKPHWAGFEAQCGIGARGMLPPPKKSNG
jgi:hypothetical protein